MSDPGSDERARQPLALERAAFDLQRQHGAAWNDLLAALAVEREVVVDALTDAPPDDLPAAQGRLQAITAILLRLRVAAHTLEHAARQSRMAAQQRRAMSAGLDTPINGH